MTGRIAVVLVALASVGCAAIFKGSKQDVRVVAIPEGADVRIDNQFAGEAPTNVKMDRNAAQHVLVSKDGYKDQQITIQRHPDAGWWVWDIGTCVIPIMLCIPLAVDALSGAWFSLDEEMRVKLDPVRPPAPAPAPPPPPTDY